MQTRRNLVTDQRGAILLIACFMAAFMCGCLWYLMGIGESTIYRERLQDGADAAAYANAVYHARGMNIIAMINLVMGSYWAVLMSLKATEILAWMLYGVVSALCACCGAYCEYVSPSQQFAQEMSNVVVPQVDKEVRQMLKTLSAKQVSIAKTVPHKGAQRAATEAKDYKRDVWYGKGFSVSQTPSDPRLGLPVQEDDMQELCDRAATVAGVVALAPLFSSKSWTGGKMPLPAYLVAGAVPGTILQLKSSMCGGGAGPSNKAAAKKAAKMACQNQAKAAAKAGEAFDLPGCLSAVDAKFPEEPAAPPPAGGAGQATEKLTPKRVYDEAKNGDDYFQTFAVTAGDQKQWWKRSDKGVEIAAWGNADVDANNPKAELQKYALTMAEFYYDTSGDWDSYKDDAMWNLRWRARLRRVRKPIGGPIPPEAVKCISYVKDMIH